MFLFIDIFFEWQYENSKIERQKKTYHKQNVADSKIRHILLSFSFQNPILQPIDTQLYTNRVVITMLLPCKSIVITS